MKHDGSVLSPGFYDLNEDGILDSVAFCYLSHAALFIAESGHLKWDREPEEGWEAFFKKAFRAGEPANPWNECRADWGTYTLLIDRDDCGRYDSPGDFCYRAFDLNGDGAPEAEYYHLFPGEDWCPWSNKFTVNLDGERDMSYLDFEKLTYPDEQAYDAGGKYRMNVHGSGFFTNSYAEHPEDSWETPIAWYDFNGDGKTEMTMRVGDTLHNEIIPSGGLAKGLDTYSGKVSEFELAFELNGNTSDENWHSLDLALSFYDYETPGLDYRKYSDYLPYMKPLPGSEPFHGRMLVTRCQPVRRYLPYLDGAKIGFDYKKWKASFLLFDEDDDDCRWEEMFAPHEGEGDRSDFHMSKNSDHLGDRTEKDPDNRGNGKLYISPLDGKLHLFGAKYCWWEIDYLALFKGSKDHPFDTEGPVPQDGMLYPRVRYFDTTGNGYLDTMRYELVRYGHEDEGGELLNEVRLADYATPDDPHPDEAPLYDPAPKCPETFFMLNNWNGQPLTKEDYEGSPAKVCYDGLKAYYTAMCARMWEGASLLYACAKRHGLNTSEALDRGLKTDYTREEAARMTEYRVPEGYSRHLGGETLREQYHNGFWLREKVFADLCACEKLDANEMRRLYYTGKYEALCAYIDKALG